MFSTRSDFVTQVSEARPGAPASFSVSGQLVELMRWANVRRRSTAFRGGKSGSAGRFWVVRVSLGVVGCFSMGDMVVSGGFGCCVEVLCEFSW